MWIASTRQVAGLVGLFCFHQYLHAPSKGVDKKTYTALWALGKRVPLTFLGGVSMWRPLTFLARTPAAPRSTKHTPSASPLSRRAPFRAPFLERRLGRPPECATLLSPPIGFWLRPLSSLSPLAQARCHSKAPR